MIIRIPECTVYVKAQGANAGNIQGHILKETTCSLPKGC
jgi:hypothetical protein